MSVDSVFQFVERRTAVQYVMRYHVPFTKSADFRRWIVDNEKALADNQPEGWVYLGTWFTVRGFGKYNCESRWEIDDYSTLGTGWGNETNQKLTREWIDFSDLGRDSETYLLKSATDIRIFE